jgi:alkylhydroperoxidase family enzyme
MVTRVPAALTGRHLETLRLHGLTDCDILDAVQVISYFNYINRVADALGIDPELEMEEAHKRWQAGPDSAL